MHSNTTVPLLGILLFAAIATRALAADESTADPCLVPRPAPIEIQPPTRYAYRGFMLDSGRHMQSIDFIKRTLDRMAYYKLNRFHWHLTEDQGWRIEIKKYPKLTEIGAWRAETTGDGKRYGGFYTQEQIR